MKDLLLRDPMDWLERIPWRALGRWWIVGLTFLGVGSGVLYVFREFFAMPLLVATLASAECTILVRFLINDRWVFGHPRPSWQRLWQFHVASAGGFVIWYTVANALPLLVPFFNLHYVLASAVGSACSVSFNMLTNFLWIWRKPDTKKAAAA